MAAVLEALRQQMLEDGQVGELQAPDIVREELARAQGTFVHISILFIYSFQLQKYSLLRVHALCFFLLPENCGSTM